MKLKKVIIRIANILAILIALFSTCHAVTYKYDSLNRLSEVVYDNGQKLVYTYDAAGNLLGVQLVSPDGLPVPPVLNGIGNRTGTEGQELQFTLTASDGNGDTLSYLAEGLPRGATLDSTTGILAWTPDYTQSGLYSMRFAVSDGALGDSEEIYLTVLDAVPSLGLSIADVTVTEGDSGTTTAIFSVSLSNPSPWDVTVDYATADDTARAGSDYAAQSGQIFFPAGDTAPRQILVAIHGDPFLEDPEEFTVNLTASRNAAVVRAQAVCTITDDDEGSLTVRPVDPGTGASPVGVTFANPTEAGQTSLAMSASGPPPPAGFRLGVPPLYYEITTTAVYTGSITVAIDYSGITYNNEAAIRLFQYEGGAWVDRTIRLDRVNRVIYAQVSSLSLFAIFEPDPALPGPAAITWERAYGGAGVELLYALQGTDDGGCIMAGEKDPVGSYVGDVWLVKLDRLGNVIWQKTYGGPGAEAASAIELASDGGYVVAGFVQPADYCDSDLLVMKVDTAGNIVWQRTFGGSGFDMATAVKTTPDGGYVVAGSTASFGHGGVDAWVLKLDPNGEVQWQMTYGGSLDDSATAILAKGDGGFVLAGQTSSFGAGNSDGWLLELDVAGAVVRQKAYGGSGADRLTAVQSTSDGGYVAVGATPITTASNYDLLVLKLTAAGEIVWQKSYSVSGVEEATSVYASADGLIVAGRTSRLISGPVAGMKMYTPLLLKLDLDGNIAWQRQYWQPIMPAGPAAALASDGGVFLGASTDQAGQADFLAVKTDADGRVKTCCGLDAEAEGTSGATALQASEAPGTGMTSTVVAGDPGLQSSTTGETASIPCECGKPFALYALDPQAGLVAYGVNAQTGTLTMLDGSPFAAGDDPSAAAVSPDGRFIYVANSGSNDVSAFAINEANGAPTGLGAPCAAGAAPVGIAVHPTGRFLYVINRDANSVTAYAVGADGSISEIPGSPRAAGSRPLAIALDPLGRFAYVVNSGEDTLSVYQIDQASGGLIPLAGSPFPTGDLPSAVAVDPFGRFVYVANSISDDISVFAIDGNTGVLTEIQGSPFPAGAGPISLAMDPYGKYLYVLDGWSREIRGFLIDIADGGLSPVAEDGYPFASGGGNLVFDPSGAFIYATNPHAGRLTIYSVARETGALQEIEGPPAVAGSSPRGAFAAHRPLPAITVTAVRQGIEGWTAGVTISLSRPCEQYVTVCYTMRDITAVAGADYVPRQSRLVFQPGVTQYSVPIQILLDTENEPEEYFLVYLENPTGAAISGGQAVVTIPSDAANHPPVFPPIGDKTVTAGSTLQFYVSGSDPDIPINLLRYSVDNLPPGASFSVSMGRGRFVWTPSLDQVGTYTVRFTVSDGRLSTTQEITITVLPPP